MTPAERAKSNTEHAHQSALFIWAFIAARHGIDAANDENSYKIQGHAEKVYGTAHALPCLDMMYAIPNGGSRGDDAKSRMIRGAQLKAEGVKPGVPDIFLPYPILAMAWHQEMFGESRPFFAETRGILCGLYIEMKKPSQKPKINGKGGVKTSQSDFKLYLQNNGYACAICYNYLDAIKVISSYLTHGINYDF